MNDAIDLMILDMEAPLVDAIVATVCARWSEAADLWFDVHSRQKFVDVARLCGLEAAIRAGEFELAAYFEIGAVEVAEWPEMLSGLLYQYRYLRGERKKYFARVCVGTAADSEALEIREMVRLRFHKKAIATILAMKLESGHFRRFATLLAECYHALGFHDALTALGAAYPRQLAAADTAEMLRFAGDMSRRGKELPMALCRQFEMHHPAGPLLLAESQLRQH